jgi:TrmH family RNA methyltransferase
VRRLRRLLHKSATREADGAFVAEGIELVRTALESGAPVQTVFVAAEASGDPTVEDLLVWAEGAGARISVLAPGVLAKVADTVTPQPVMAVVAREPAPLAQATAEATLVVALSGVRDPGNAGTVLRSAEAAGADAVVFGDTSVDPWNPKTVRASAGAIFQLPVAEVSDVPAALATLRPRCRILGAVVRGGTDYLEVDWTEPSVLVLGNEAAGLSPAVLEVLDEAVAVPMAGRAESLNVGVACAVFCFEALRQRRRAGGGPEAHGP